MDKCVLYFGGDKISLTVASPDINMTYKTRIFRETGYSGIVNSEFVNMAELPDIMESLFKNIHVGKITIGVPATFCNVSVVKRNKGFEVTRKINKSDVAEIVGSLRPIYFKIDGGEPMINPVGAVACENIEVYLSRLVISPEFLTAVKGCPAILRSAKKINYVPVPLACAKYLIDEGIRDKTCTIINSDMFSTSVSVVCGDQLVTCETVQSGSAHLVNDISLVLHVDWEKANDMYNKFVSKSQVGTGGDGTLDGILTARLEDMTEQIHSYMTGYDKNLFSRPVYICGGYVDNVPGAVALFSKLLETKIRQLSCPFTETNKPDMVCRDAVIAVD